jgi:hypothetical protein
VEGGGRGVILRCYSGIRLEGLRKITKNPRDEILIQDLPNMKQER